MPGKLTHFAYRLLVLLAQHALYPLESSLHPLYSALVSDLPWPLEP